MADPVSFCLRLTVREGQLEPLRTLMHEMVASTENEPGTLAYEWFLGEDRSTCHIYERYAGSAALVAHLGNFGAFAERFMACVEPAGLDVYGDPSADARTALAGLGPIYLRSIGGFAR